MCSEECQCSMQQTRMKKVEPSLIGKAMNQRKQKTRRLRASETHDKRTRKKRTENSVLRKGSNVCPHALKSIKCFTDTVRNPTRGDIVARDKPVSAKGNSMIGAFVTQNSTMTVHVLHGKTQSVLNTNHRLLTCERQLHMCAGLNRAQTNSSSMHGILKKNMTVRPEPQGHEDQDKTKLQSWQSFQRCCWSVFGHQKRPNGPRW